MKKNGKGNTPCWSEVSRENMDDVMDFNACDKADDIKCTKMIKKEDLVDYSHQEEVEDSLDCI